MGFNTDCIDPTCGSENAYFNGVNYECPDCGTEWDDNNSIWDDDEEED